ncbi:MAG: hypothetical protein NTV34_17740 [Proteobacteria bacterium]|nr:hypothetical protein [Pseudomonadota bacterium]
MATIKKMLCNRRIFLTIFLFCSYAGISRSAESSIGEAPDPKALRAYKQFWEAFKDHEQRESNSKIAEFERAKDGLNAAYELEDRAAMDARLKLLDEGIRKYESNLADLPNASNRPYVLLNLAQMLAEYASINHGSDSGASDLSRQKALTTLKEIETRFPDFEYKNDALYHRALLLEGANETDAALPVWRSLAGSTRADRYALHANLAAGDWEFEHANPELALKYYDKAKELLPAMSPDQKSIDEVRIYYRIGWAAYKATKHPRAIEAAKILLNPGISAKASRQREKIISDATDIIGFSLYEQDDIVKLKATIQSPVFSRYSGAIALAAMTRYQASAQHERVALIGAFAREQLGSVAEYPSILVLAANSNQALGRTIAKIEHLEKLAMLLPAGSLWRVKHSTNITLVKLMESRAAEAAQTAASFHYENGIASNSPRWFRQAAYFYDILIQDQSNSHNAIAWRLRKANCLLYAGELQKANELLGEIIGSLKTTDDTLSVAMYQRAITLEKIWRHSLEIATKNGKEIVSDSEALKALTELEECVEEHGNKFPNQPRSVDLILVAASANRDHNRFKEAAKFWQRSLLSNPTDVQRAIAVRGLVFAQLRSGSSAEVISMVTKFLKLESSKTLSLNLRGELKGVLSSAASNEAQRRARLGQNEAAGDLLVEVSNEFRDIPNREQLFRDGAYMIGIGGNWASADRAATQYIKEGNKKYWGDMTYLAARSAEFQMKFPNAVLLYIDLAAREPKHARAGIALDRAEKLAISDENYAQAAKARLLAAESSSALGIKLASLSVACDHQLRANNLAGALATASLRKRESSSVAEKMESEALLAKVRYLSGDRQTAIDDMDTIGKQLDRNRLNLGDKYSPLAALVGLFLAEDLRVKFQEFRLSDRKNLSQAVEAKSEMFAGLTRHYDKVASLDQPEASPKARYFLAVSATEFAEELSGLPSRSGEPLTLKSQTRFNQNISRLTDMAKRYHSNNILAKQRAPQTYAQSEWVRKSAVILGSNAGEESTMPGRDQTTSAVQMEVPQQWNY